MSKERLTVADEDLGNGMKRCHIIDRNEVRKHAMDFYWRLKEYEDLEEQGLLLRLPCKVGNTVYTVVNECKGDSAGCYRTCDNCNNRRLGIEETKFSIDIIDEIGNWYFLTQSEAEEKLRELEGK